MRLFNRPVLAGIAGLLVLLIASCNWGSPDEPPILLTDLSLEDVTLSPEFDPQVNSYTAVVPYDVDSVTVTVVAEQEDLVVTIGEEQLLPGDGTLTIALETGANVITITVSRGTESASYTVTVTRTVPQMRLFGKLTYDDEQESEIESGSTIDFGQILDWPPETEEITFRIESVGTQALRLTGTEPQLVVITGDTANFDVADQPSETTIPPGDSVDFLVVFAPAGPLGSKSATAMIDTDDPDNETFELSLIGETAC